MLETSISYGERIHPASDRLCPERPLTPVGWLICCRQKLHTLELVDGCTLPSRELPSLKLSTWKWMVGIRSFPFEMAYFQGRTVSFREGKICHQTGSLENHRLQSALRREMLVSRRVYHWLSSDGLVELVVFVCEISWLLPLVYRLPIMLSTRIICNHQIIMKCIHCKIFDVNILKFPKRVLTG